MKHKKHMLNALIIKRKIRVVAYAMWKIINPTVIFQMQIFRIYLIYNIWHVSFAAWLARSAKKTIYANYMRI